MSKAAATSRSAKQLLFLLSTVVCLTSAPQASAAEAPVAAKGDKPLTGTVTTGVIKAAVGLKEMDHSANMLQRSAMDMIGEVERTNWEVAAEPDAIGPIIIPAISFPSTGLGDILPPRKKWVDFLMKQMGQLIDIVDSDINNTVLPPDSGTDLTTAWGNVKATMLDVVAHYDNLKTLTAGPKLENLKIGKEALAIYDDMSKLNNTNKMLTHHLRVEDAEKRTASDDK